MLSVYRNNSNIKMAVFCNVEACRLVDTNQLHQGLANFSLLCATLAIHISIGAAKKINVMDIKQNCFSLIWRV